VRRCIAPFLAQFSRPDPAPPREAFAAGADGLLRRPGTLRPVIEDFVALQVFGLGTMTTRVAPDEPDPDVVRASSRRLAHQLETRIVTFVPDPDVIRTRRARESRLRP